MTNIYYVSPLPTFETGMMLPLYMVPKRKLVYIFVFFDPLPFVAPITIRSN